MELSTEQPVIQMKKVDKIYWQGDVQVQALKEISLEVSKGEFTAICGPSGSGKTTILNLIGALDSPSSGDILLEGINLSQQSRSRLSHLRCHRIGFVFQAYNLVPVLTAFENAEVVLSLQNIARPERTKRVMDLLAEVGLEGMEHRRPHQLSGGQQQRVAIARAIAANPAVVLADEPTANVDSETAEHLLDIMERLNQTLQKTFIFSTHDPRVMKRARRIIHLKDGRIDRVDCQG